jgi:acetyl-CoA C-acetyltransferase
LTDSLRRDNASSGATGAILMTKLVSDPQRRKAKHGLQTMCIGHGMATATIIERL